MLSSTQRMSWWGSTEVLPHRRVQQQPSTCALPSASMVRWVRMTELIGQLGSISAAGRAILRSVVVSHHTLREADLSRRARLGGAMPQHSAAGKDAGRAYAAAWLSPQLAVGFHEALA